MIDIHLSGAIYDDLRRAAEDLRAPLDAVITDLLSDRVALGLQAPSSEWRAIPAVIATLSVPLPDKLLSELHMLASGAGQQLPVVIYNLLNVALPSEPPPLPLGYLRTEPGRGRVFGMYFEIAGFQYALLRHLAGDHLSVRQIMDVAFISLARLAASSGSLNGHEISATARQFAMKVMMIENRRRAPGKSSPAPS